MSPQFYDFKRFPHSTNRDGTIDSICPRCFMTVATSRNEADLDRMELLHECQSDPWHRCMPDSNNYTDGDENDPLHGGGNRGSETSKSIH